MLAEASVDGYLLGGDYCAFGPWPCETLARLRELEGATWIRGNGERWLLEPPPDRPETWEELELARVALGAGAVEWLYRLPETERRGGVLFTHGSPLSDVESFTREPSDDDERLLAGETSRTVVFGHSHVQFVRGGPAGTRLVNPGSVGQPLDGDRRAAWALLDGDRIELRRTAYDAESAARAIEARGGGLAAEIAGRLRHGR